MVTLQVRVVKATVAAGPAAAPPAGPDYVAARVTGERNVRATADGGPDGRPRRQRGERRHDGHSALPGAQQRRQRLQRPQSRLAPDESSTCPTPSGRRPGSGLLYIENTQNKQRNKKMIVKYQSTQVSL